MIFFLRFLICLKLYLLIRTCRNYVLFKLILHQFWVKKIFPWKLNLEYGGTFTTVFMHVSRRNMFPTTRNLQIRVHVYFPHHCCGDWLTFGCFVLMIADHNLVKKSFGPMIADHDLVSCCVNQIFLQLFLCGTHGIYMYVYFCSSTEHCAWAIISPKESRAYHLHYCTGKQNYLLSNILWFALKICFWADF